MADITITATSVVKGDNANIVTGYAGEAIAAGQAVFVDTAAANVIKLADNDLGSPADAKTVAGVALNGGATGQPIAYQNSGEITIGGTVAIGEVYCLSSTAGGIAPVADVGTGDRLAIIGWGKTAAIITLAITNTGIDHA